MENKERKWDETVEIHYENLPVDNDEASGYIDWTYKPFKDDVKDFLMKFAPENIQNSDSDEEIENYLEDNFDILFDEHIKEIEKEFRDDAIEDANENYYYDEEAAMWDQADRDYDYQVDMEIMRSNKNEDWAMNNTGKIYLNEDYDATSYMPSREHLAYVIHNVTAWTRPYSPKNLSDVGEVAVACHRYDDDYEVENYIAAIEYYDMFDENGNVTGDIYD